MDTGIEPKLRYAIEKEGPISFETFMDLILYDPEDGYYNLVSDPIGTQGDFYTLPHLTPAVGAMICRQLNELWILLGKKARFDVLEIGAGNGNLGKAILDHAQSLDEFSDALHYTIVEQSFHMRARAKEILGSRVNFFRSVDEVPGDFDCVLTNELFDNLSCHQVRMDDDLMEIRVDYDGKFRECVRPASTQLRQYLQGLGVQLPRGNRAEINLAAVNYIQKISAKIKKGFAITIDYGYRSDDLCHGHIRDGTLACYHKHTVHHDPYINLGHQDITSHVNFSALGHYGRKQGLQSTGLVSLGNFFRALGLTPYVIANSVDARQSAYVLHLLLNQASSKFKVLVQHKGMPAPFLTGLSFREPVGV